jgi:hypothetical protein
MTTSTLRQPLTEEHFRSYEEDGYCILKNYVSPQEVEALKQRVDDIMMGRMVYEGMFFQLDPSMMMAGEDPKRDSSFAGPSLNYRKIKDLEYDDLFLRFLQNDVFRVMAERYIGKNVSSMRAMVFNKPANSPLLLPYHQDISENWEMTIPPVLTIWTALDEATIANGCLEIVPRSQKHGKIGTGHTITAEVEAKYASKGSSMLVELKPGESIIFHNGVLHRSGANTTDKPRRALTLCLMDGATRHRKTGKSYPVIFGEGALKVEDVKKTRKIPPHVYE